MTTAHRPTWSAAVGQKEQGGWSMGGTVSAQFAARDLPAHKKLKVRAPGQNTASEVAMKDLREQLLSREASVQRDDKIDDKIRLLHANRALSLTADAHQDGENSTALVERMKKYGDSDEEDESGSDSDDSSDDEEAELMRELEKIKQERLEEEMAKVEEKDSAVEQVLDGNPLTENSSAVVKRRWNDDVVFKNQSRNEPEGKKRFINDVIRSDFHRKFLSKYIQ